MYNDTWKHHFKLHNMNKYNPCTNCDKRVVGCHGSCEEYLEFSNKLAENKKKKIKQDYEEYVWRTTISGATFKRFY